MESPYYRRDLALVHHLGFGYHADVCAPGILRLLEPVRERTGLVVEIGCGSGALTRHLVNAGHRVIATDASPAMLGLARANVPEAEDVRALTLGDGPIPEADAIVSVGHVINYLSDAGAIERALVAIAGAIRPGGVFAIDVCDLEWAVARRDTPIHARVTEDWTLITRFSTPSADRFVRDITVFVRERDGSWRRDDERHDNVLIDTARIPALLEKHGIEVSVGPAFGTEQLPAGLYAVIGRRLAPDARRA